MSNTHSIRLAIAAAVWLGVIMSSGCSSLTSQTAGLDAYELPRGDFATGPASVDVNGVRQYGPEAPPAELSKVTLPDYVIEPPDVLLIEGIKLVPKAPNAISSQDILQIVVLGTVPEQPIAGQFLVESNGNVNLGPGYGSVNLSGLTSDEASDAIREMLLAELQSVEVSVTIYQAAGQQGVMNEHLVAPDGTVNLGVYGRVFVAGLTLDDARTAIEARLSKYFEEPRVSVDVFVYNSKFYYIIVEGGGVGDRVVRVNITGNETVLDAIAQVGGFDQASSNKMWISRPTPGGGCDQVLPVDWDSITRGASTGTNWQLLPGDRLFVAENHMIAWANLTSIMLNPVERLIGFTLLGGQTVQTLQRFPEGFGQRGF